MISHFGHRCGREVSQDRRLSECGKESGHLPIKELTLLLRVEVDEGLLKLPLSEAEVGKMK